MLVLAIIIFNKDSLKTMMRSSVEYVDGYYCEDEGTNPQKTENGYECFVTSSILPGVLGDLDSNNKIDINDQNIIESMIG